MAQADDRSYRARRDAAADLCGVDLILECERAASRRNSARSRPKTMEQERLVSLSLHRSPRSKPRGLGAHPRTIAPNREPAAQ